MTTLNTTITKSMLSQLEKILVLERGHGMTVTRIKQLCAAKKVTKVNAKKSILEQFIDQAFWFANRNLNKSSISLDVYMVSRDAKSSMLSLAAKVVVAFEPNEDQCKEIHNANVKIKMIQHVRALADKANEIHVELEQAIRKNKAATNNIKEWNKPLSNLCSRYGKSEHAESMAVLKKNFRTTW